MQLGGGTLIRYLPWGRTRRVKQQRVQQRRRPPRQDPEKRPATPSGEGSASPWSDARWPIFAAAGLTLLLSLPLFEPLSWFPLGFVVFIPWIVSLCVARNGRLVYVTAYLLGSAYFLIHLRWLYATTGAGYVAASLYLAVYFLLAAWPIRHLCHRRNVPAVAAFPIGWAAAEFLRSHGPLAFPWFMLGHSQIRFLSMIQVVDLAGVVGLSFVLAVVNGWLADLVMMRWRLWPGSRSRHALHGAWDGGIAAVLLVVVTFGYGRYRLATEELVEGPLVAVIQGDFLLEAVRGSQGVSDLEKMRTYLNLMEQAAQESPDLIVLPETPWAMILNPEILAHEPGWGNFQRAFTERARRYGNFIVVGGMSEFPQPEGSYPAAHRHNSAFVYPPDGGPPGRYDKIHLVPFGEFVPFRYTQGLFWLYRFLNDGWFNPWGRGGIEYSLTPGSAFGTFAMQARSLEARPFRFGVTICYEDVIPQVFRRFVRGGDGDKRVDFMLNISNDGWFGHGGQQPQHLVNCAFRAVENRVAVARAVNTGVSGFLRPDGSWHDLVSDPDRRPQAGGIGYRMARLAIDPRPSVYSRYGDWLGLLCGLISLAALGDWGIRRFRRAPANGPTAKQESDS